MEPIEPTSLVHGCNIISQYLRYFLVPMGFLYKFDPNPPHKPRPLPLLVALYNFFPVLFTLILAMLISLMLRAIDGHSDEYRAVTDSVFIQRLFKITRIYRFVLIIASSSIILAQHGPITNVIASGNNYVTEREQSYYAKKTFLFFSLNMFANSASYFVVLSSAYHIEEGSTLLFHSLLTGMLWAIFLVRLSNCAILIYTSYLGSMLGKHVENFSKLYIDTMFDQFMKAIEKEGGAGVENGSFMNQVRPLPFFESSSSDADVGQESEGEERKRGYWGACSHGCLAFWRVVIKVITFLYNLIRNILIRLNMRRYPELPEMKMTKLSSTTNIQISETMRVANNHMIRIRLRRTQIMLSELRDLVSDINKTSSPIVMMYLIFETLSIILITTASVQAKFYKSVNIFILPTISLTLGLVANVVYICVAYDETTKQLKLLINKLFDLIIMNHRVKSTARRANRSKAQVHADDSEVCIIPGSEVGAINETWSQFQYTRKLANTIQFTMGGILPVTRRLVLSILGHVLSAVFISIEIMSIIDTMNTPPNTNAGHGGHSRGHNSSSAQFDATELHHRHQHRSTAG